MRGNEIRDVTIPNRARSEKRRAIMRDRRAGLYYNQPAARRRIAGRRNARHGQPAPAGVEKVLPVDADDRTRLCTEPESCQCLAIPADWGEIADRAVAGGIRTFAVNAG